MSNNLKQNNNVGNLSDGYHTFNQLYHQRAVLFATIVNQNANKSWKSFKHEDGNYCFDSNGEWFIVGIDTPEGSYTYHYEKKYWGMFKCKELSCGKHWDGHTEEDVIRLLSLCTQQENTVSEEIYTQEYLARKEADLELYKLKNKIKEIKNEIANYKLSSNEKEDMDEDSIKWGMKIAYDILDRYLNDTETWHGFHGDIIAPKGTFDRIYNECDTEDDGI